MNFSSRLASVMRNDARKQMHAPKLVEPQVRPGVYKVFHRHNAGAHLVAILVARDLDTVFHATQHLESDWDENPLIDCLDTSPRSTSVGDIVEDPDGKWWRVEPLGWSEVSPV